MHSYPRRTGPYDWYEENVAITENVSHLRSEASWYRIKRIWFEGWLAAEELEDAFFEEFTQVDCEPSLRLASLGHVSSRVPYLDLSCIELTADVKEG